jgi:DNA gyrase/topoisomerase IV subunit B
MAAVGPVRLPPKLDDCRRHGVGSGAELFVVEGDSAATTVRIVRETETQAVLPMMGKPLNAAKASPGRLAAYPPFVALADAMGAGHGSTFTLDQRRYDRVVLLMDADADGIHCAALMCLYFYRMMWPLLDGGHVWMAQPPMAAVTSAGGTVRHVFTDEEYRGVTAAAKREGEGALQVVRYRGLASIELGTLADACVRPATRVIRRLGPADVDAVRTVLGGGVVPTPTLF